MTHRERHTPEEAPARNATWTPPANRSASSTDFGGTGAQPAAAPDRRNAGPPGDLWTDWYHRASASQQQEALLRAIQQGVVYAHQLPAPAHSTAPLRPLLSRLLNGEVKELSPLNPPALEYHDDELDWMQREAVARAVATPDVCLIQGLPGTGKSRLLAEIILQAAQRGERVLFLAPNTAALDSVLERLSQHPAVCPIRCLGADESLTDLPAAIACLTLPERLHYYRETTLPAARAVRDAALGTLHVRLREQAHWPQLETLAGQHEQLSERLRILTERRDGIAAEVERLEPSDLVGERSDLSSPSSTWESARAEVVEHVVGQLAGLQAELETTTAKQTQLDSEWETIRPLAEAWQGRRLWTGAWWRALRRSGLREQVRDLEARRAELESARHRLEQDRIARQNERIEIENRYAVERRSLQEAEIARRRAEVDSEIAAVKRDQDSLGEQWRTVCASLPGEAIPSEISQSSVAIARAAWEQLREQDAQRSAAAEQWLQTIEEGVQTLPEKLAGCANVIAATTTALPGDTDSRNPPVFDLLILDQIHQVTEPEFAAAARRARRWVLIGEPHEPEALATDANTSLTLPARRHSPLATRHFFQRLWQNLHTDPYRLPFAWMRRGDRLLCRLRPLAPGQEKWIETEPVVDRQDIELRILSLPRQAPQIVEVLFPVCVDICEAKQFIFHELEELAVQTRGRSLCWVETAEEVILQFVRRADSETTTIALEAGVCERIACLPADGGMDWHTCSLEFVRAAGWTRQRAEEWIAEQLGLHSPGRTVLLATPYRLNPPPCTAPSCPTRQKNQTTNHTKHTRKKTKDILGS